MRRISLALALTGAVAAIGCGQTSTSNTGGSRGVADNTFTVSVQNGQVNGVPGVNTALVIKNGYVTSSPSGIDCGGATHNACDVDFPAGAPVVLTSHPTVPTDTVLFAGDCSGQGPATTTLCTLNGPSDKYVALAFGIVGIHPNWNDPATHAPNYLGLIATPPTQTTWNCLVCHGATLAGQGMAVTCQGCHWTGVPNVGMHEQTAGHNDSGACVRCHTGAGLRDYIGADATADNHLSGYTLPSNYLNAAAVDATVSTVAPLANGIHCDACHNARTALGALGLGTPKGNLNDIQFPTSSDPTTGAPRAGHTVSNVGPVVAICGQCHTGARDGRNIAQVYKNLAANGGATGLNQDVQLASSNATVRPHYLSAAATLLGEEAGIYVQYGFSPTAYTPNNYTARNLHGGVNQCSFCHNPHTGGITEQVAGKCGACHFNEAGASVANFIELEESRQFGFEGDIDGDLNATESLKAEIDGMKANLLAAMRKYGTSVAGADLCVKLSGTGLADDINLFTDTTKACNYTDPATGTKYNDKVYNKMTPRLLKATFNYMAIANDPGAWAHNPRYAIEVLYDTIADLNTGLLAKGFTGSPNGNRSFDSHFGAAEVEDPSQYAAFVYHGTLQTSGDYVALTGFTSPDCYQCHGGNGGFSAYLALGPAASLPPSVITDANKVTGVQCSTCHAFDGVDMKGLRTDITTVYVPPQKTAANAGVVAFPASSLPKSFAVCGTCHSGRENNSTIVNKVAGMADQAAFTQSINNPHYLGAAGMMLGTDAKVMFEYNPAGKAYTARPAFWKTGTNGDAPGPHGSPHGAACQGCHRPKDTKHSFEITAADMTDVAPAGYCGACHTVTAHGDFRLSLIKDEYDAAAGELLTAIRAYATANKAALATATGVADFQTVCYNNSSYSYWKIETSAGCTATNFSKADAKLLKAGYNYLWTQKEPGAWAHNEFYAMQVIYDAIKDIGGTPSFTVTVSDPVTFQPIPALSRP